MTYADAPPGQRVFRRKAPYLLTHAVCAGALDQLAAAIVQEMPVTALIGIAGGGRHPAEQLAARLHVPALHVTARHNATDALYTSASGAVSVTIPDDFPCALGGQLLLVDDICGTGATFGAVTTALTPRLATETRMETVALCRNVGSRTRPRWWAWEVDDWVVFPWEPSPGIAVRPLPHPERIHTA